MINPIPALAFGVTCALALEFFAFMLKRSRAGYLLHGRHPDLGRVLAERERSSEAELMHAVEALLVVTGTLHPDAFHEPNRFTVFKRAWANLASELRKRAARHALYSHDFSQIEGGLRELYGVATPEDLEDVLKMKHAGMLECGDDLIDAMSDRMSRSKAKGA